MHNVDLIKTLQCGCCTDLYENFGSRECATALGEIPQSSRFVQYRCTCSRRLCAEGQKSIQVAPFRRRGHHLQLGSDVFIEVRDVRGSRLARRAYERPKIIDQTAPLPHLGERAANDIGDSLDMPSRI